MIKMLSEETKRKNEEYFKGFDKEIAPKESILKGTLFDDPIFRAVLFFVVLQAFIKLIEMYY